MFRLQATWTFMPFPVRPIQVRMFAHISSFTFPDWQSEAYRAVDERVHRWSPPREDILAVRDTLTFAGRPVDSRMVEDTSDGVSHLRVGGFVDDIAYDFSVQVMASGYDGEDAPAVRRFVGVLSDVLDTKLSPFF